MVMVRIAAVAAPFNRQVVLGPAVGLLKRAVALGLLDKRETVETLDLDLVREIAAEASATGVGRDAALAILADEPKPEALARLIERLDAALIASPLPERELRVLGRTFGVDDLAALLGISAVSLRRYAAGTRTIPDPLADRIHWLAFVVSDLAGAYNEVGVRRWFDRPRTALDGRSPREALGRDWTPSDPDADRVRGLAAALTGVGGST